MFKESWLDKLNRKLNRYALRNLMTYIVAGTAIVWLLETIVSVRTGFSLFYWLYFDKALILQGQVWRVLTFLFIPSTYNIALLAVSLYFYWLIGNALEREWGSFRFDMFYLGGVLGAIVSGFITGYATTYYLHLSLFLAFAILYPDHQVLVFFLIPVKMKWLAIIDLALLVYECIFSTWAQRLALVFALVNVAIFFSGVMIWKIKNFFRRKKFQREAKRKDDGDYPFDL